MRLVRFLVPLLFAAALSPPALGQAKAGPFTIKSSTSPCATIQVTNQATVGIQVTGTFSATLQPEVAIIGRDGSTGTPQNTQATPSTSNTAQSTITAAGNYTASVAGYDTFLLCVTSFVSGSATIFLNASDKVNATLLGGGGGASFATLTGGTNTSAAMVVGSGASLSVPTQALGDATTLAASDAFVQNALVSTIGVIATMYGVLGEGHEAYNAGWTTSSAVVTCASCAFTTNAQVGNIVFGTNLAANGGTTASVVQLGGAANPATILSIDSATQIHISTSSGITTNAAGHLFWGADETTALSNAWTAANAICTALILPGINPEQTGPALMFTQSAQFNGSTCPAGGASRAGLGIAGSGINSSYLVVTPGFNPASCTHGASGHACFLASTDGANIHDFSIYGGGNGQPGSGFASVVAVEIEATNNAFVRDMLFIGWGANATNGIFDGLRFDNGAIVVSNVTSDMFGQNGCDLDPSNGNGFVMANQLQCTDNSENSLLIRGDGTVSMNTTNSWFGGLSNGNAVAIAGSSGATPATWYSANDQICCSQDATVDNGVSVGRYRTAVPSFVNGYGIAHITNLYACCSASENMLETIINGGVTAVIYIANSYVFNTGGSSNVVANYGTIYDLGGNQFVCSSCAQLYYPGLGGTLVGQASITGIPVTAAKAVLSGGWGSTASWTAISGFNSFLGTITSAGTGQATSATITYTFPNPYLTAPAFCTAIQIGGTNALGTFATSSLTATGVVFTFSGLPVSTQTDIVQVTCYN